MKPHFSDDQVTLWHGDALDVAREMPSGSADCIVTSPPYFGLRDYGIEGQYGLEESPAAHVETMRELFNELRRVLADDGVMFVNIGDSYASNGTSGAQGKTGQRADRTFTAVGMGAAGLPAKNPLGIPWRVAFALQADGWILRNSIVWAKPNAMPESVTDRLSGKHEMVFLFSKRARYWFDLDAIREPCVTADRPILPRDLSQRAGQWAAGSGGNHRSSGPEGVGRNELGRNPGDVWAINTQPFAAAHFACMPRALAERCVQAGCTPRRCTVCGHAPTKITETGDLVPTATGANMRTQREAGHVGTAAASRDFGGNGRTSLPRRERITTGWTDCGHNSYRAGAVLDPFSGSGTTGLAAARHGRRYVGIDLNREYLDLSLKTRLQAATLDFEEGA